MNVKINYSVVMLFVFVLVFRINTVANDTIRFTWQADTSSKNFIIVATLGKQFTINWGDDSSVVKTGTGYTQTINHNYANANFYTVTISANTIECRFMQFECQNNQLSSLDVSNSPALTVLQCSNNQLSSLDVSKNTVLTGLYCYYNELNGLDVSKNTALTTLLCYLNPLNSLDVSKNPYLVSLWCAFNRLSSLDVSKNTALSTLWCPSNQIKSLDVSNCPDLVTLWCSGNRLSSLDVSKNADLVTLWCSDNQLNSLNIGDNQALNYIYCYDNCLPLSDLFAVSEMIFSQENKFLGTQTLPPQTVSIGDTLFSENSIFNNIYTTYSVVTYYGDSVPASDYTVADGMIIFNNTGSYVVTMTNSAIVSDTNFPVQAIAEITVSDVGIVGAYRIRPQIYPNPTTGKIIIGFPISDMRFSDIQIYDIIGKLQESRISDIGKSDIVLDISHLAAGLYFLKVGGKMVKVVKE